MQIHALRHRCFFVVCLGLLASIALAAEYGAHIYPSGSHPYSPVGITEAGVQQPTKQPSGGQVRVGNHNKASGQARASASVGMLTILPPASTIDGSYGMQTLSVVSRSDDGSETDVTASIALNSSNPAVVKVVEGVAYPVGDGEATLTATSGGKQATAKIIVKNTKTDSSLSVAMDITPILLKDGCNGSSCHGAQNGQSGFKLSFFGYEPDKDREAIWTTNDGRRVNAKDPASSLLIAKALNAVPHAGGKRFAKGSSEHRTLIAWIRAGGPLGPTAPRSATQPQSGIKLTAVETQKASISEQPSLESISVLPAERMVRTTGENHQLIVIGTYSDGSTRDVTATSRYFSDDEGIVSAASTGKIKPLRDGEANIMVRYAGKAAVSRMYVVQKAATASYPKIPESNFIDAHVLAKLKRMNIAPSGLSTDAEFIRRVSLDIAGVLPTSSAVREFVANKEPNKRAKLIDDLLERPEYQDVMTIEWSELLRINRLFLQEAGVREYTAYVRDCFADNRPFDEFVRDLISAGAVKREDVEKSRNAEGKAEQALYRLNSNYRNGPPNFYRVTADPTELTTSTSQIFLGVRLDCCRCHNHPFDRWSMKDFYGFAAYFAGTGHLPGKERDEVIVFTDQNAQVANPRDGKIVNPKPLTVKDGKQDLTVERRRRLADWMTSRDNPFFAKATVNRFWKHFFGRGIVHPPDDFRATNPPVNEPLLDALAQDFVAHNFDVKHLIRTICNSRIYQLSDQTNSTNERDSKNFSHFYTKRLGPEVLFDAIVTATGVPENFGGAVARRATNLPDNSVGSYFLDVFGRSRRLQVQDRSDQTSMSQALHLMNGGTINDRIAHPQGKIARILQSQLSQDDVIEEIYLASLSRMPTDVEKKAATFYIAKCPTPKEGYEDLMWAILNSREFIFNH